MRSTAGELSKPTTGRSCKRRFAVGLAGAVTCALILSLASPAHGVAPTAIDTNYAIDESANLKNPERGMYFSGLPGSGEFHTIVPEWLWLDTVCGENLTWNGYNAIGTSKVLNDYAKKLRIPRTNGVKVLFRPRYDKANDGRTQRLHDQWCQGTSCGQREPTVQPHRCRRRDARGHRDVIAYIQAGYLGRWGEWNTTTSRRCAAPLQSYGSQRRHRSRAVRVRCDEVLQQVELRRPVFALEVVRRNPTANVGLHNDCFMTNSSDMGTYSIFSSSHPQRRGGEIPKQRRCEGVGAIISRQTRASAAKHVRCTNDPGDPNIRPSGGARATT